MVRGHRLSEAAEEALTVVAGELGTGVVPYSGGPGLEAVFEIGDASPIAGVRGGNAPRPLRVGRDGRPVRPRPVQDRGRGNDSSAAARPEASVPILR